MITCGARGDFVGDTAGVLRSWNASCASGRSAPRSFSRISRVVRSRHSQRGCCRGRYSSDGSPRRASVIPASTSRRHPAVIPTGSRRRVWSTADAASPKYAVSVAHIWRRETCRACLGGNGLICRQHLIAGEDPQPQLVTSLEELADRLDAFLRPMTFGGPHASERERASCIEALGWFYGWDYAYEVGIVGRGRETL